MRAYLGWRGSGPGLRTSPTSPWWWRSSSWSSRCRCCRRGWPHSVCPGSEKISDLRSLMETNCDRSSPRTWRWVINNSGIVLAGQAEETLPEHTPARPLDGGLRSRLLFLHHHHRHRRRHYHQHHYCLLPNQFPPENDDLYNTSLFSVTASVSV